MMVCQLTSLCLFWHYTGRNETWNEAYTHKLVVAWMWVLLSFWLAIVSQESSCCISENTCNKNSGCRFCMMVCPKFWENYFYTYLHLCLGVDDVNGSYGNLMLLFEMKYVIKFKCVFSKIRAHKYMKFEVIDSR
jgi:hypothetical protein